MPRINVVNDTDCEVIVIPGPEGSYTVSVYKRQNWAIRWLWSFVWQKWLDDGDKVIRVTGWRSALIETSYGRRRGLACCFWWFT